LPSSITDFEELEVTRVTVTRGLDPRVHLLRKMDCRVKPGNDE